MQIKHSIQITAKKNLKYVKTAINSEKHLRNDFTILNLSLSRQINFKTKVTFWKTARIEH